MSNVQTVVLDGIKYYVFENRYAIVEGFENELMQQKVKIPNVVNGYPVLAIADFAFINTDIEEIDLPESIEAIGSMAFQSCEKLTAIYGTNYSANSMVAPMVVGLGAFSGCINLHSFATVQNIARVCDLAFSDCGNLQHLKVSVKHVEREAFNGCPKLSALNFLHNAEICDDGIKNSGIKTIRFLGDAKISKKVVDSLQKNDVEIICYGESNLFDLAYQGLPVVFYDD